MTTGQETSTDEEQKPAASGNPSGGAVSHARGVRRFDGGHPQAELDASGATDGCGGAIDESVEGPSGAGGFFEVAAMYSGPMAAPHVLAEYEAVVPGAAARLLESHLRSEQVRSDAIERLTKAESWAVLIGSSGAQALTIGGLVAAVVLIATGHPYFAVAAIIPGVLGGAAQVAAAVNKRRDQ